MKRVEENVLIVDCIANNIVAKKTLYDIYVSKMFMICMRYADNREDAEDILHDAFIKIFDNLSRFRGEGSLEGWIRRIVTTTAIKHYQKKNPIYPVTTIESAEIEEEEGFLEKLSAHYSMNDLLQLIQSLAPRYRMVFNLYVIDGYSHQQIAQTLNISEGTSKSQLSRAREILKNKILEMQKLNIHVSSEK
jgi:RNA polymerase sigma factor (sigma-70 family)